MTTDPSELADLSTAGRDHAERRALDDRRLAAHLRRARAADVFAAQLDAAGFDPTPTDHTKE